MSVSSLLSNEVIVDKLLTIQLPQIVSDLSSVYQKILTSSTVSQSGIGIDVNTTTDITLVNTFSTTIGDNATYSFTLNHPSITPYSIIAVSVGNINANNTYFTCGIYAQNYGSVSVNLHNVGSSITGSLKVVVNILKF